MKKALTYILVLTIVTIATVSGTYALFSSTVTDRNAIQGGTHKIKVRYTGDLEISGYIELVKSKEEGFRRTISIAEEEDSIPVVANLYIYLTNITAGFASEALNWELYELNGEEETYIDSGHFEGYVSGDKVYMLKGLDIDTTTKEYAIYLWLDGYKAGNEVVGATLRGHIGAETEPITGITS